MNYHWVWCNVTLVHIINDKLHFGQVVMIADFTPISVDYHARCSFEHETVVVKAGPIEAKKEWGILQNAAASFKRLSFPPLNNFPTISTLHSCGVLVCEFV